MNFAGLDEEEKQFIKQQIEEKGIEAAKYLRWLIQRGLREERIEIAIQLYQSRKISISGAAEEAGVSIYDFLEILRMKGYISSYDLEDFQRGLDLLKNV